MRLEYAWLGPPVKPLRITFDSYSDESPPPTTLKRRHGEQTTEPWPGLEVELDHRAEAVNDRDSVQPEHAVRSVGATAQLSRVQAADALINAYWTVFENLDGSDVTMANPEHGDEIDAKNVLQSQTAYRVEHADHFGGVDYRSSDGSVAMEVTTVTSEGLKASATRRGALLNTKTAMPTAGVCWWVTVDERHPRLKGLEARVVNALDVLEAGGVKQFWSRSAHTALIGNLDRQIAETTLLRERVEHAEQTPEMCSHEEAVHEHGVHWSTSGSYVASGSDAALLEIEGTLNDKPDNYRKLAESGAETTVLFAWVDQDTEGSITRPLRDGVADNWDHFGLPTRAPELNESVDELWVVHRQTRRGWRYTADGWAALEGV